MAEVLVAIVIVVVGAVLVPFFGYLFGRFMSLGFLKGLKEQFKSAERKKHREEKR